LHIAKCISGAKKYLISYQAAIHILYIHVDHLLAPNTLEENHMNPPLLATHKQLTELPEKMAETARILASHVLLIDAELQKVDAIMNDFQPPVSGKIRIEWYSSKGRIYPTPVIWKRTRQGGLWRAERASAKNLASRVKTARQFHKTARGMKLLAKRASALIALRQQALQRVAIFNRTVGSLLAYARPEVEKHGKWLDEVRRRVTRKWDLRDKL
jgi:hypothetical protein